MLGGAILIKQDLIINLETETEKNTIYYFLDYRRTNISVFTPAPISGSVL